MEKHIEQILQERILNEVLSINDSTSYYALGNILASSTGCKIPIIDNTKDYTNEVEVLCVNVLRSFISKKLRIFGSVDKHSLLEILSELLLGRVNGDPSFGVLSRNVSIYDAAVALSARKISAGFSCPDGISLAQIICGAATSYDTTFEDENVGWTLKRGIEIKRYLPNCEKVLLGCEKIDFNGSGVIFNGNVEYHFPHLKKVNHIKPGNSRGVGLFPCTVQKSDIYMPEVEEFNGSILHGDSSSTTDDNIPFGFYAPKLTKFVKNFFSSYNKSSTGICSVILGPLTHNFKFSKYTSSGSSYMFARNLIHFEVGKGTKANLNLAGWSPTTAIAEHLDEFLYNFQTYIADRVADRTGQSALTLTLSSEVYAALEAQEGQTILATLANKNWTVASA